MDCLFCKIVNGEVPSTKVYEDEWVYAFKDINPQAAFHAVIIPKEHILENVKDITAENSTVIAKFLRRRQKSLTKTDSKTVTELLQIAVKMRRRVFIISIFICSEASFWAKI